MQAVSTATGREVAQVATLSSETTQMMGENYGQVADKFNKMADAIDKFSQTFDFLTEKVSSTRQIPGVELAVNITEHMNPMLGGILNSVLNVIDAMAKFHQKMIDLRIESIKTGAAFAMSAAEIKRYSGQQLAMFGQLQSTLFISKQQFDDYQRFLRTSAFGVRDLEQPILVQGKQAAALTYVFAIASRTTVEMDDMLRDIEAMSTKMGHAGKNQQEIFQGAIRSYVEMMEVSQRLGGVSVPYIRQQVFQAISGQEAAITNSEAKMHSLTNAFEKFWVGLGPGERGLAGEFLQKLNKGFMDMEIGMAAWMATPQAGGQMGDLTDALDLLMAFRSGEGQGDISAATQKLNARLTETFHVPVESWENFNKDARNKNAQASAQHMAQVGMIMKMFKTPYDESEKLMHLIAVQNDPTKGKTERESAAKGVGDILRGAADVQKMQLNFLERIERKVRGLFMKYMYEDSDATEELRNKIGTIQEFQKKMADEAVSKENARRQAAGQGKLTAQETDALRRSEMEKAEGTYYQLQESAQVGAFSGKSEAQIYEEGRTLMGVGSEEARSAGFGPAPPGVTPQVAPASAAGQKMARIIEENRGRVYGHTGRSSGTGAIDCSGFSGLFYEQLYEDIYKNDPEKLRRMKASIEAGYGYRPSQLQVTAGRLLNPEAFEPGRNQMIPPTVRAGDLIGVSRAGTSISATEHVAVIVDRGNGLEAWESRGGGGGFHGVQGQPLAGFLRAYNKWNVYFVRPRGMETPEAQRYLDIAAKAGKDGKTVTPDAAKSAGIVGTMKDWASTGWRWGVSTIRSWKDTAGWAMKGGMMAGSENFNGLYGATEGAFSSLHSGEFRVSPELAEKIRARGGVMATVTQAGLLQRADVESRRILSAYLKMRSGIDSLKDAKGVLGDLAIGTSPRFDLVAAGRPAGADREAAMRQYMLISGIMKTMNVGFDEAASIEARFRKLSEGGTIRADQTHPIPNELDRFSGLIKRIMLGEQRGVAADVPKTFAIAAPSAWGSMPQQSNLRDLLAAKAKSESWDYYKNALRENMLPPSVPAVPRQAQADQFIRPSQLPIEPRRQENPQLPPDMRQEKKAEASKQPIFIKPNVTNRITIGNVSARVDRIVMQPVNTSGESNDIPW